MFMHFAIGRYNSCWGNNSNWISTVVSPKPLSPYYYYYKLTCTKNKQGFSQKPQRNKAAHNLMDPRFCGINTYI